MKITTVFLCLSIFLVSVPFAFAQTKTANTFKVNTLVNDGKKSREVSSILMFEENSVKSANLKTAATIKEFNYADIKSADYSYSKKPLLSTGGAIATAILVGVLVIPFLFMKKKQHWLSVRTENDYAVIRLDNNNFRQVINELETHQVAVTTINEDENSKKKDGK
jgi:hypothetical protein